MKKRLLAILLTVTMLLTMLPSIALATDAVQSADVPEILAADVSEASFESASDDTADDESETVTYFTDIKFISTSGGTITFSESSDGQTDVSIIDSGTYYYFTIYGNSMTGTSYSCLLSGGSGTTTVYYGSRFTIDYSTSDDLWVITLKLSNGMALYSSTCYIAYLGGNVPTPDVPDDPSDYSFYDYNDEYILYPEDSDEYNEQQSWWLSIEFPSEALAIKYCWGIKFSVSDETILTINSVDTTQGGKYASYTVDVTPHKPGNVTITATLPNGVSKEFSLSVEAAITANDTLNVISGEEYTLASVRLDTANAAYLQELLESIEITGEECSASALRVEVADDGKSAQLYGTVLLSYFSSSHSLTLKTPCGQKKEITVNDETPPREFDPETDGNSYNHSNGFFDSIIYQDIFHLFPKHDRVQQFTESYAEEHNMGFYNVVDYKIQDSTIRSRLLDPFNKKTKNIIIQRMQDFWEGSCLGVASTIAQVYTGALSVDYLAAGDEDADCYYNLPLPYKDSTFLDQINFYQLLQYAVPDDYYCSGAKLKKDAAPAMQNLMNLLDQHEAVIFSFGYTETDEQDGHAIREGHSILALRYWKNSDGTYTVKLFDENGKGFHYLTISSDLKSFSFSDGNRVNSGLGDNYFTQNNLNYVSYVFYEGSTGTESAAAQTTDASLTAQLSESGEAETTYLAVDMNSDFTLTNAEGKTLVFRDGSIQEDESTMTVLQSWPVSNGDSSQYMVEIYASDYYDVNNLTSDSFDMDVSWDSAFLSIAGDNFDCAENIRFSSAAEITLAKDESGQAISFTAYVVPTNEISMDDPAMEKISGVATADTRIAATADSAEITSDAEILSLNQETVATTSCSHIYDEGTTTVSATATARGIMTYTCTKCGHTYVETLPSQKDLETEKKDQTLSAPDDYYMTPGWNWLVYTYFEDAVGTVTYTSSNEDVAYFASDSIWDPQEGILWSKSYGKTIITVTASGNDEYNSATVSFPVEVVLDSGKCGDTAKWVIPDDTGTLKIVGTGTAEFAYNSGSYNWEAYVDSVKNVIVEAGITTIGDELFVDSTDVSNGTLGKLTGSPVSITLSDTVETIGRWAFGYCPNLEYVYLGAGVKTVGKYAFTYDPNLVSIEVSEDNPYFTSVDGALYSKDMTVLYRLPHNGMTTYTIPDGVTTISYDAVGDMDTLTSITIPASVKTIMMEAFEGSSNLKNVYYKGTKSEWAAITIGGYNTCLTDADIHYHYGSDHTWDNGVISGTCTAGCILTYSCTGCGETKTEALPATGHTWDAGKVTKAATCAATGVKTYTCTVCGETKTEAIPKTTEHTWDAGKVTRAATATTDGVKTYTCTVCGKTKTEAIPATGVQTSPFMDVQKSSEYYYTPVLWAVEKEITAGTDSTHFSPNATCTRGQVVTFLWRAAGKPTVSGTNPFVDVKKSDYFYDAVLWAVSKGITNGTDATHFSPNAKCTRGQVVTFMYRAAENTAVGSSTNPFTDVKNSDYFYNPVLWAVDQGITKGTSTTTFSPNQTCTRGQVVTFLYRYLGQ